MTNILQKMFLSKQQNQLINAINNSYINADYDSDVNHLAMNTTYIIEQNGLVIVAKHQWHYSQGDNYTLTINNHGMLSNVPNKYTSSDSVKSQKEAKKIFMRMRNQYIKQRQK